MPDTWLVELGDDKTYYLVFDKSENMTEATELATVAIIEGVLSGTESYIDVADYLDKLQKGMIEFFDMEPTAMSYNKEKTPGTYLYGYSNKGQCNIEMYSFMNNYNDCVAIIYYDDPKNEANYTNEIKDMVDSMEFSYQGFMNE